MRTMAPGFVAVAIGLLYLVKPNLFRRGLWMKTSLAIRWLSEENYTRYMKILGTILIVVGSALIIYELAAYVALR